MECPSCSSHVVDGKFCPECGNPLRVTQSTGIDPGTLVTKWHALRSELETAREMSHAVASEMDDIALTLNREHSIQLPVQADGNGISPPAAFSEPPTESSAPPTAPEEPFPQPDEAPRAKPTGKTKTMLEGTKTGPMGGEDQSGSAAEEPVGPSEAAVEASRVGTAATQRPTGTIEDDHEGKADSTVDEARIDSGVHQGEAPLDDPRQFQDQVAATIRKAGTGKG